MEIFRHTNVLPKICEISNYLVKGLCDEKHLGVKKQNKTQALENEI